MKHAAIAEGNTAVITGGAGGIGLAAAIRLAEKGLNICIVDLGREHLETAAMAIAEASSRGRDAVMTAEIDVSIADDLAQLSEQVTDRFGGTDILMNNAGIQPGSTMFGPAENWGRILGVNLGGVISGTQAFVPAMIARSRAGLVINTGSKQGITTPPGDPAYNVSKAGVKVFTEALAHDLRNREGCAITAHLLIPGFVFTGLTARGRTEKPSGAWTADQTVNFMFEKIDAGDFYILCPDNEVTRELDEKRILWAAGDIVENRPPLSRWHKDYGAAFADFLNS